MAVISGTSYMTLQADLGSARDTVSSAKQDLFDAVYTVVLLDVIIPEVDLLNTFWSTYQGNAGMWDSVTNLLGAVRALQQHVISRSDYTTVDEFIYNEIYNPSGGEDLVEASFKYMSDLAGYTINALYAFTS